MNQSNEGCGMKYILLMISISVICFVVFDDWDRNKYFSMKIGVKSEEPFALCSFMLINWHLIVYS